MDTKEKKAKYLRHEDLVREVTITDDMVYLNEKEAAKLTGKALSTLRNDRHHRRGIPYIKDQSSIKYSRLDILSYLEARKITFQEE